MVVDGGWWKEKLEQKQIRQQFSLGAVFFTMNFWNFQWSLSSSFLWFPCHNLMLEIFLKFYWTFDVEVLRFAFLSTFSFMLFLGICFVVLFSLWFYLWFFLAKALFIFRNSILNYFSCLILFRYPFIIFLLSLFLLCVVIWLSKIGSKA